MNLRSKHCALLCLIQLTIFGSGLQQLCVAAEPESVVRETPEQRDARMAWWREARFGMFIHWGLYAVPAGHWKGQPIGGIGEWIMDKANIPVEEYEPLAKKFNPLKFDAASWVRTAKNAGMKYIVITSKHHDGFCLFDTDATQWDVVDASPYDGLRVAAR